MPPHESILSDGLHRRDDQPAARWPVVAVALLGLVALVVGFLTTQGAGDVEQQRDAAVAEKVDLGRDVASACSRGVVVQTPEGQDLCQRAAQAQSAPVPVTPLQGERGDPGRPPTPEEIQGAVERYCAAHGDCAGRPPTTAEVAAAVAEYLIAHPPQPGRAPTAAEISAAVATYFTANPPPAGQRGPRGEKGEPGATGERGPGPTPEQIDAAVAEWLDDHPVETTCPSGTTLQPVTFESGEDGLGCVNDEQPSPPETTEPTPTQEPDEGEDSGG